MKRGVSACIIGKDEEKNLHRCLKSIVNVVDEIVYLDTGSSDSSIEIVKSYKGKVFKENFENDFSKVRNKSISYANYEWILCIDCDEELSLNSQRNLRDVLSFNDAEGVVINIINIINGEYWDKLQFPRIFRNRKEYVFQGKIHEQIAPAIAEISGINSLKPYDLNILHYGYSYDCHTEEIKHNRNLKILNSIEEKDRNDYFYFNLGNEYARVNDYNNAIINYEIATNLIKSRELYTVLLYERLAHFYYLTKKYEKCICTSKIGIKEYSGHMYFYYIVGLSYIEQMKFTNALKYLNKSRVFLEYNEINKEYIPTGFGIRNKKELYEAIEELKQCVISNEENMLTTIVDCRGENEINVETLYSINEVSSKIIILKDKENSQDIREILNYEEKVCEKCEPIKNIISGIKDYITTKYILLLNNNEGMTFDDQKELYNVISTEGKGAYYLFNFIENRNEIRLVKKEKIDLLNNYAKNNKSNLQISYFK